MREIKFRAWDKINCCWFKQINPQGNPVNNCFIDFDGWIWKKENINSIDSDKNDSLSKGEFELMQFTGLKDKNGKEIYEDDILRLINHPIITTLGDPDVYKRIVGWQEDESKFDFKQIDNEWQGSGFTFCKDNLEKHFEVIGNIYENHELLAS